MDYLNTKKEEARKAREAMAKEAKPAEAKPKAKAAARREGGPPPEVRALWGKEGLEISTKEITSMPDNIPMKLHMMRPASAKGQTLPLVFYNHGGGMATNSAYDVGHAAWGRMIAHLGVMVILPDFRNYEQPTESQPLIAPYPGGLTDCYSALKWCYEHAAEIGVDPKKITIAGESGGSNLAIATVLKCKKEGTLDMVSGLYALCPYIAGSWPQDVTNEGILGESHLAKHSNGYFILAGGTREMSNVAVCYGAEAFRNKDPMAWPGFATVEDLKGFPRSYISTNDCDPLRDEGQKFYQRLNAAGVQAMSRNVLGTFHGGDTYCANVPDIAMETATSIVNFAKGGPTAKL